MPDPLVSTDDLSDYLGRDIADDPAALIAVDSASDIVRNITGITFNAGTATAVLDGSGTDALILPEAPITSVEGTALVNGESISDFEWSGDGLLTRGIAGGGTRPIWPQGRRNVSITYQYGLGTADAEFPRDVKMVALMIASRLTIQGVAQSETIGDASMTYAVPALELTANELRILQRYRRPKS